MQKIIFCTLMTLSLNAFAVAQKPWPTCPAIGVIQAGGFDSAKKQDGAYTISKTSHYDTADKWLFIISKVEAASQYDAYTKAAASLSTLSGNPMSIYSNFHFVCRYHIGFGYDANAYALV